MLLYYSGNTENKWYMMQVAVHMRGLPCTATKKREMSSMISMRAIIDGKQYFGSTAVGLLEEIRRNDLKNMDRASDIESYIELQKKEYEFKTGKAMRLPNGDTETRAFALLRANSRTGRWRLEQLEKPDDGYDYRGKAAEIKYEKCCKQYQARLQRYHAKLQRYPVVEAMYFQMLAEQERFRSQPYSPIFRTPLYLFYLVKGKMYVDLGSIRYEITPENIEYFFATESFPATGIPLLDAPNRYWSDFYRVLREYIWLHYDIEPIKLGVTKKYFYVVRRYEMQCAQSLGLFVFDERLYNPRDLFVWLGGNLYVRGIDGNILVANESFQPACSENEPQEKTETKKHEQPETRSTNIMDYLVPAGTASGRREGYAPIHDHRKALFAEARKLVKQPQTIMDSSQSMYHFIYNDTNIVTYDKNKNIFGKGLVKLTLPIFYKTVPYSSDFQPGFSEHLSTTLFRLTCGNTDNLDSLAQTIASIEMSRVPKGYISIIKCGSDDTEAAVFEFFERLYGVKPKKLTRLCDKRNIIEFLSEN